MKLQIYANPRIAQELIDTHRAGEAPHRLVVDTAYEPDSDEIIGWVIRLNLNVERRFLHADRHGRTEYRRMVPVLDRPTPTRITTEGTQR